MNKEKFLKAYQSAPPLPIDDIVATRQIEHKRSALATPIPFSGTVDNVEIDLESGRSKVRIYTPEGSGPFPVILYMHGGGFCIGSPDTSDNLCRTIAQSAKAVLVSVDYKLAPEHKFPTALEECYQLACWIKDNDVALNTCSDQLVVAGESSGGNLAAAICLMNRSRQELTISHQVLICPVLDQATPHQDKITKIEDPVLTVQICQAFSNYYFTAPSDTDNPLASPLLATDFSNLPSATIVTAELDVLADEAVRYGEKLSQAKVEVIHHHYLGVVHAFPVFINVIDEANEVAEKIGHYLATKFSTQ